MAGMSIRACPNMGQQKTQQLYFNRAMIISMNIQEQPIYVKRFLDKPICCLLGFNGISSL